MVEVFKTNILQRELAGQIASTILDRFPSFKINFDLDDCDKILRIEGSNICPKAVIELIEISGFECELLE